MLQRIQTLYLLGVFICALVLFFTPLASVTTSGNSYQFAIAGFDMVGNGIQKRIVSTLALVVLNALVCGISFLAIFTFKNRLKQILIARIGLLMLVLLVASLFYYFENALAVIGDLDKLNSANGQEVNYSVAASLPLLAIVLIILAIRAINQDEELVRSADRIR
ncbi:MAG: DUF4293 domain-containing protein [Bacteroidetes bacterium]|nr:DUF4293 domain-containing protein [Bacteroidota bacterium]